MNLAQIDPSTLERSGWDRSVSNQQETFECDYCGGLLGTADHWAHRDGTVVCSRVCIIKLQEDHDHA